MLLLLPFFSQPERDETNDYSPPSVNLKQTIGSISYGFPTETGKNQSEPKGVWGGEQPNTHTNVLYCRNSRCSAKLCSTR